MGKKKTKSRGKGRPTVKEKKLRNQKFELRISADDRTSIETQAAAAGRTVSAWVRERLGLEPAKYGEPKA